MTLHEEVIVEGRAADPVEVMVVLERAGSGQAGYVVRATVGDRPAVSGTFEPPAQDWDQAQERGEVARGASTTDVTVERGVRLFDALFSGSLRRCWVQAIGDARGRGLRVVVRSGDLAVHGMPWELLFDRVLINRHLMLLDGWTVVRSVSRPPAAPLPLKACSELNVLVVTSTSPMTELDTEQDVAIVRGAWRGASIEFRPGAETAKVAKALKEHRVDVLHVATSGLEVPGGTQYLAIGDASSTNPMAVVDMISAPRLLDMIDQSKRPRLVVLAGSDTDLLAAELARDIPAVIGMRGAVSDRGCVAFMRGFYRAVGRGASVVDGVSAGRMEQRALTGSVGADWAAPVVFVSAEHRLVLPDVSQAVAATLPRVQPTVVATEGSAGSRLHLELEMRTLDLNALLEQWGPLDEELWPDLVVGCRDGLEAEISEATRKLRPQP